MGFPQLTNVWLKPRVARSKELVLLLSLPAAARGAAGVLLTKKVISGLSRYAELWDGPVRAIFPPSAHDGGSGNLDDVVVARDELPFLVDILPLGSEEMLERVRGAALTMGGADYRLTGMAARCRDWGVPYVFNSEYSLQTRWQVARAEKKGLLRYLHSLAWEWQLERSFVREVEASAGVQCNGTPTFDAYAPRAKSSLLYFDTRTSRALLARSEDIHDKARRRAAGGPLRLAFSGRLSPMKGADHLSLVARELAALGLDFTLDICGAGSCEAELRRDVERWDLGARVRFRGVLDFATELMPLVRREIDLFVCCHRQGDPSCTYLETFACGVPIAGYANEAFAGLLRQVDAGWSAPLDDARALARKIVEVAGREGAITRAAEEALRFAEEHTFEETFARRIEHLRSLRAD